MSKFMLRVGLKALELVQDQLDKGEDMDGKKYAYSTNPFARPAGGMPLKNRKEFIKDERIKPFETKQGKAWVIIEGGYKDYRLMTGRNPVGDFLDFTGAMLQSMSVRENSDSEAEIYFTDEEQAKKAFWLSVSGAGKSRKTWRFFGLTDENTTKLEEYAAGLLTSEDIEKMFLASR